MAFLWYSAIDEADTDMTPDPFDAVNEAGTNDLDKTTSDPTVMRCRFDGTNGNCFGRGDFTAYTPASSDTLPHFLCSFRAPEYGTHAGSPVATIIRFRDQGGSGNLYDIELDHHLMPLQGRFRLTDKIGTGGTVTGTKLINENTWYELRLDFDQTNQQIKLYVDGALDITCSIGSALGSMNQFRMGWVDGSVLPSDEVLHFRNEIYLDDGGDSNGSQGTVPGGNTQSFIGSVTFPYGF